jgi:hypothetical protein
MGERERKRDVVVAAAAAASADADAAAPSRLPSSLVDLALAVERLPVQNLAIAVAANFCHSITALTSSRFVKKTPSKTPDALAVVPHDTPAILAVTTVLF